jgi:hypothetical protein
VCGDVEFLNVKTNGTYSNVCSLEVNFGRLRLSIFYTRYYETSVFLESKNVDLD